MSSAWRRIPYNEQPDFSRPLLEISQDATNCLLRRLSAIYGEQIALANMPELIRLLKVHHAHKPDELIESEKHIDTADRFTERDMVLITYGDMIRAENRSPLAALATFLELLRRRVPVFNTLHILPFFPYSSDRGFSITDYHAVDPALGSWRDIQTIGGSFKLMFDGVFNHASSQSRAFREMLSGNMDYWDFAITFRSSDELTAEQRSMLRRPRTSSVLTKYYSIDGPIWVWTTFSPDQIDLNFRNPKVLMTVIDTLLLYVRRGADIVRIDAATYMWHEPGTSSASLAQTHELIKMFRDVLDVAAPRVALVTETNVPHAENISYFGNGYDEAQMVYNFALPPLVLHAFYREDASWLSEWARNLEYPTSHTTYLNILDTHDGVGLMGAAEILPADELKFMMERAAAHGALISHRTLEGGGEAAYEINTTWYSALNLTDSGEDREFQVRRFTASRSIALALRGVPGIYFHGLIGSRNDLEAAVRSGIKRDLNRALVDDAALRRQLRLPGSKINLIAQHLGKLLEIRVRAAAFHPNGAQRVLNAGRQVFALLRTSPDGKQHLLALTNVSAGITQIRISLAELGFTETQWYCLTGGRGWTAVDGELHPELQPYEVAWLAPLGELGLDKTDGHAHKL